MKRNEPRCPECQALLFYSITRHTWRCCTWNCPEREKEHDQPPIKDRTHETTATAQQG